MKEKILKLLSKLAVITGIAIILSNYLNISKKQNNESQNIHNSFYKKIEPDMVFKEWQSLYKYEKANTLPDQKAKTFTFPMARVSGRDSTMMVYIEPISIEISASENLFFGYKIGFDLPKDERLN